MRTSFKLTFAAWELLSLFPLALAQRPSSPTCRFLPEDEGWPSHQEWSKLNATVGGRLIATIPLASVCHDPNFNETECAALAAGWALPQTQ